MGKANAMRIYAKCPPNLWDEFYLTASFLNEWMPTVLLDGGTPYKAYYNHPLDYSRLCEIGYQVFILILNQHNPKVYDCSLECVLIGYDLNSKIYQCYNQTKKQVYLSYHVCFIESHEMSSIVPPPPPNPTTSPIPTSIPDISQSATSLLIVINIEEEETLPKNLCDLLEIPIPDANPDLQGTLDDIMTPGITPTTGHCSSQIQNTKVTKAAGVPSQLDKVHQEVAESRKRVEEERTEKKWKRLENIRNDEIWNDPAWLDEEAREHLQREGVNMLTRGEADSEQVNETWVADNEVENLQQMFKNINANDWIIEANRVDNILAAIDPWMLGAGDEPRDWDDAQWHSPSEVAEWKTAFEDEVKSLKDMGIYILIPHSEVPKGTKICHCKAILRNKLNENGNLAQ